jgi:NitT/TauT family transport system permease protein
MSEIQARAGTVWKTTSESAATAGRAPGRAGRRWTSSPVVKRLGVILPPLVVVALAVVAWGVWVDAAHIKAYLVPPPDKVFHRFVSDRSSIWKAFSSTATSALYGYLAAIGTGFLIAMLFASSSVVRRSFYPFAIVLQTTPILAIAPLIIVWIGPGKTAVVVVTFIITVFPIIANSTIGLMSTDHNLINLFEINNANRRQMLWKLRIPNAMPYVVTGLRISAGLSVIGAIVGEVFAGQGGASAGLGALITFASARLRTDLLFAAALASSALGIAFFLIVSSLGNFAIRNWHESAVTHEN